MSIPYIQPELAEYIEYCQSHPFHARILQHLIRYPVDVATFATDKKFLGLSLYPENVAELTRMANPVVPGMTSGLRLGAPNREIVLTGALGLGKTTIMDILLLYQVYILSCLDSPQTLLGLDPASEIVLVAQSLGFKTTKKVIYDRIYNMVSASLYFKKYFAPDKNVKSELKFPGNIQILPLSGEANASIGLNALGGGIDEINHMAYVARSSKMDGKALDQAQEMYKNLDSRIKSRSAADGSTLTYLVISGSARNFDSFSELKKKERREDIAKHGKSDIYIYDYPIWDIKPDNFSGEVFYVDCGSVNNDPRIVNEPSQNTIEVPEEFRSEFEDDIVTSLLNRAGKPIRAIHPYLANQDKIKAAISGKSILSKQVATFKGDDRPKLFTGRIENPTSPRWVHLDPASKHDSFGIVCGHVTGGHSTPHIKIDFALEVPPEKGEIPHSGIRQFIFNMTRYLPIRVVSADMRGEHLLTDFKNAGYIAQYISCDRPTANGRIQHNSYATLKKMLYEGFVTFPPHERLEKELNELEYDDQRAKVDHPTSGSKDVSDCLASVVVGLTYALPPYHWTRLDGLRIPHPEANTVTTLDDLPGAVPQFQVTVCGNPYVGDDLGAVLRGEFSEDSL